MLCSYQWMVDLLKSAIDCDNIDPDPTFIIKEFTEASIVTSDNGFVIIDTRDNMQYIITVKINNINRNDVI